MMKSLPDVLTKHRQWLAAIFTLLSLVLSAGLTGLYQNNNYNIFFDPDDPHKMSLDRQEAEFTHVDNLVLLIKPRNQPIFTDESLRALQWITKQAWQTPYSSRVDSLTNFQLLRSVGEELVVEDFFSPQTEYTIAELADLKLEAMNDVRIVKRFVDSDATTSLVNITLRLPPYPAAELDSAQKKKALIERDQSIREVVSWAHEFSDRIGQRYPQTDIHLHGEATINQALTEASERDAASLIPLMFVLVIALLGILLRSPAAMVVATLVIIFSITSTMGVLGWMGKPVNMVTVVVPIIVLTISVCDCVHILTNYFDALSKGQTTLNAMIESLWLNARPVFITSITTAIGFLTLNFSASPPFRELGNLCAFGIMYAMLISFTLIPYFSIRFISSPPSRYRPSSFSAVSDFSLKYRNKILIVFTLLLIGSAFLIPNNQIDDDPALYFKTGNSYRNAMDFSQTTLPGVNDVNFSIGCNSENCIFDPEFLSFADDFSAWLKQQQHVESVQSYADTIKRINFSFNQEAMEAYVIPSSHDEAAQLNLLFELSLPMGFDLNNLVNHDKSAIRIRAFLRQTSTGEILSFEKKAYSWLSTHSSNYSVSRGASIRMMFAALGEENIRGMIQGSLFALLGITLALLVSLGSVRYALVSLIPNSLPAIIALGVWGATVAHVNMAVAAVFSITLGIVVDDTVHFVSKYQAARSEFGMPAAEAVPYAFSKVGLALLRTTTVLIVGFSVLCLSDFNLNAYLGALTAITIFIALVLDFLLLPNLLLQIDKPTAERR